jgi:hypothetical protein
MPHLVVIPNQKVVIITVISVILLGFSVSE